MMELDLVLVSFCFLGGYQWSYEISIPFVCPPFQLLIQLMDLQESWNNVMSVEATPAQYF